jgi:hypothetical protein
MKITDNFLPTEVFKELQNYCKENEFEIVKAGEKEFSILNVPENIYPFLEIEGYDIIFSFIRNAYKEFDTTWRRHADNIINGYKTDMASVLYINNNTNITKNGTAFYNHIKYGKSLPKNISENEYNRMIIEDSEDDSKWDITQIVEAKPNRMLIYCSQDFHSKYPNKINIGERIVLVSFYIKKPSKY